MKPLTVVAALFVLSFSGAVSSAGEDRESSRTFLDTLNRGRELMIFSPDSFRQSGTSKTMTSEYGSAGQTDGSDVMLDTREAGVVPSRYMVQVLASTSQVQVKQEKRKLTAQIKLPLFISFESPYYKLLAGDASQRSEAENILAQIKKLGYNDAWIVRTALTKR